MEVARARGAWREGRRRSSTFVPPGASGEEAALRALFRRHNPVGGKISRREYMRFLLFERLSSASANAIQLFVAMDTDRDGAVDQMEFATGVRQLGFTEAGGGFTDEDVAWLFSALDSEADAEASDPISFNLNLSSIPY